MRTISKSNLISKQGAVLVLLFLFEAVFSQHEFSTVLYGVSYYHEYMPYERLETDIKMMQDAGITVVRMGESTWSLWEPEEGRFEFGWMDRVVDRMHKAGIKVIMGTPTYSVPAWLAKKYPEILVQRTDGTKAGYGIRQNMDITNPTYLFFAERVIRKISEHYAANPAVIGFQVDNETTTYGAANYGFLRGFVDYMKKKYKTTSYLNKLWGLNYWGMTLNDWDEFPDRKDATNPSYKLEWERYGQKVVADFISWQASIVNEYKRPDQFVMHDFMPLHRGQNYIHCGKNLDILALNIYHGVQEDLTGYELGIADDFTRSAKRTNFIITETNAQTTGWDAKKQFPPYDGQIRLSVYSHLASGANMVAYWHWHSLHYGQETYWKGVIGHDLESNRVYEEVSRTAHELRDIGPSLTNLKIENKAAILYSMDSRIGLSNMPIREGDVYLDITRQAYKSLFEQNIGVDFVFAENADFSGYKLIIVPPLYIASDSLLQKLSDFVKNGGTVIMWFKSGFCDENSVVRWQKMPGLLREACGFYYQEFSSGKKGLTLKDDPFRVGKDQNYTNDWVDFIIPETAASLAMYDHPFYEKFPAITSNRFGNGKLVYLGTGVSDAVLKKLILNAASGAGILDNRQGLQYPLVVRSGKNDKGKEIHYIMNFSNKNQPFVYSFAGGKNLINGNQVFSGEKFVLKPWDLAIIEE